MWYKVGICLWTGWIVLWDGAFPCGTYPNINIVWQWLIGELDDEVSKVMEGGQYLIMSSGQHDYIDKMMTDARA